MTFLDLAKDSLVHIAALFTVAAMFSRDQLVLRALLLISTLLYIVYYAIIPATPLWDAIGWSAAMVLVNAVVMARIALDRAPVAMSEDEARFFQSFEAMTPGQFRTLMKIATPRVAAVDTTVTRQGAPVDSLYFVLEGEIEVTKGGRTFAVKPGTFIGEIGFLLERPATATVVLKAGARYVEWPVPALSRLFVRSPSLEVAVGTRLNSDLAAKLAAS